MMSKKKFHVSKRMDIMDNMLMKVREELEMVLREFTKTNICMKVTYFAELFRVLAE
jgi:hypothetical protein